MTVPCQNSCENKLKKFAFVHMSSNLFEILSFLISFMRYDIMCAKKQKHLKKTVLGENFNIFVYFKYLVFLSVLVLSCFKNTKGKKFLY